MAKKKDDLTESGLDDNKEFDFDFDDDLDTDSWSEFDDSEDKPRGKRKPTLGSTTKEVIKEVVSTDTLRAVGNKVSNEFKSIGRGYDATVDTISEISRFKDEAVRDIMPAVQRAKRAARLYVPKLEKLLPSRAYDKLKKLVEGEEDRREASAEEVQAGVIGANIAEVFKAQQDVQKDYYLKDKADEMVKTKMDSSRHEESTSVLYQLRNILKSNQLFFQGTFQRYLMKSLELKYKHLFLTKDILDQTRLTVNILESKLDAIKHNTALPDVVKRRKSEEVGQMMRERLYGKAVDTVGEWTAGFRSKLMKNVKEKVFKQFSSTFEEMIGGAADMAETAEEMRQMENEMGMGDKKSPLAKLSSFLVKRLLVDTGFIALQSGIGGEKFKDFDSAIKEMSDQVPYKMREFAESQEGWIGDILKAIIPDLSQNRGHLDQLLEDRGTDEVPFDLITRRSIIEIIPGFLAKILQKTESIAEATKFHIKRITPAKQQAQLDALTGQDELVFDRSSEDFIRASEYKGRLKDKLFSSETERTDDMQLIVNQLYAGFKRRGGEDEGFKEALPDIIRFITNVTKHAQVVSPKRIAAYLKGKDLKEHEQAYLDSIFKDVPESARERLADILATSFFKDLEDEVVEDDILKTIGPLLRQLSIEKDKYIKELGKIQAYGGRRFIKDITQRTTDEDVAPEVAKLRREFARKHGKKFYDEKPEARQEFENQVAKLKRRTGLRHASIRDIQSDVDQDLLMHRAKEAESGIQSTINKKEASRKFEDQRSVGTRLKEGFQEVYSKRWKKATDIAGAISGYSKDSYSAAGNLYDRTTKAASDTYDKVDLQAIEEGLKVRAQRLGLPSSREELLKLAKEKPEELYSTAKAKARDLGLPTDKESISKLAESLRNYISKEIANEVTEETGIPNRDEVQVSGPGVYFQGAKRELHIPLNQSREAIKEKLDELSELFGTQKSKFSEKLSGAKKKYAPELEQKLGELSELLGTRKDRLSEILEGTKNTYGSELHKELDDLVEFFNTHKDEPAKVLGSTKDKLADRYRGAKDTLGPSVERNLNRLVEFFGATSGKFSEGWHRKFSKSEDETEPSRVDTRTGRHAKPEESPLDKLTTVVKSIEAKMTDHFAYSSEMDEVKIHILNQLLLGQSRQEIITHGDDTSKRSTSLMSRMLQFPKAAVKGAGRVTGAYFRTSMRFYKALFNTGRKFIPNMIRKSLDVAKSGVGAAGEILPKIMKGYLNLLTTTVSGLFGISTKGLDAVKKMFTPKERFYDVYRKDEVDLGRPLIKGSDIKAGKCVYSDGKPVKDSLTITGPVFDSESKQLLVSSEDLRHGLVNYKNEELVDKMSLTGIGLSLTKKAIVGYGKFLKGTVEVGRDTVGWALDHLKGFLGRGPKATSGDSSDKIDRITIKELITDHLVKIQDLLDPLHKHYMDQLVREGSYEDYIRDKKDGEKKRTRARDLRPDKSGRDASGKVGLTSLFGTGDKDGGGGGMMAGAAGLYGLQKLKGLGGKLKGLGSRIFGGKAAATATSTAAKSVGRLALGQAARSVLMYGAMAATGVAGAISAPVVLTGLAIAGVAAAGYGTYRYLKGKQRRFELTKFRNRAYKVPESYIKPLTDYEDAIAEACTSGKVLNAKQANEYIKKLGLNPEDPKHTSYFKRWYSSVFYPTIKASIDILGGLGKDFVDQDKLKDEQLAQYQDQLNGSSEFQRILSINLPLTAEAADREGVEETSPATEAVSKFNEFKKSSATAKELTAKGMAVSLNRPEPKTLGAPSVPDSSTGGLHHQTAESARRIIADAPALAASRSSSPRTVDDKLPEKLETITTLSSRDVMFRANAGAKSPQSESKLEIDIGQQTILLGDQNRLLGQIASLLSGIKNNTEHVDTVKTATVDRDDDMPDRIARPIVSKFDELISLLKGSDNKAVIETEAHHMRAGEIRRMTFREGGISVRRGTFASDV